MKSGIDDYVQMERSQFISVEVEVLCCLVFATRSRTLENMTSDGIIAYPKQCALLSRPRIGINTIWELLIKKEIAARLQW